MKMYAISKDDSFSSFPVPADKGDIMDNIINDSWNASNIDQKDTNKPDEPMSPQEL